MSTSTLSSSDICARVRARWVPGLAVNFRERVDHNIALCIPGGCERLARAVKDTNDRAWLTTELVGKVPAQGKIDLTNADYAGMLIDTFRLPGAINTNAASVITFHHVTSLNELKAADHTLDPNCVWYHLHGPRLVFKNPVDGALNTYATSLNLVGSYIPDLGSASRPMVGELNDQLIDRVHEIVKEMGGLPFLTLDPDKAAQVVQQGR